MKNYLLILSAFFIISCSSVIDEPICNCTLETYQIGEIDIDYPIKSEGTTDYNCEDNGTEINRTETTYQLIFCDSTL